MRERRKKKDEIRVARESKTSAGKTKMRKKVKKKMRKGRRGEKEGGQGERPWDKY